MHVALFVPCFVDMFFPHTAKATLSLLRHLDLDVAFPSHQTCCGQPQYNAGHRDLATELAHKFCSVFSPYDAIVSPSGSCTAMVRHHYPELIGDNPVTHRVFELSEFLAVQMNHIDFNASLPGSAAVHIGCHARRQLGIAPHVHALLRHVRGLTTVSVPSDTWCCGFGGTFSVKFPEVSASMGKRKLAPILDAGVDYLISTDPSCSMHMQGLLRRQGVAKPEIVHLADVLATGIQS